MAVLKQGSRPPWVGLAAALWLQIAAGNAYNFPLYSSTLKSMLGLNQQQLTVLGVANDMGENVGILPGIACNKFPPWVLLVIGALGSFIGYGVVWLAVSQTVPNLPYWLLWIALCIATNSSAWFGTVVLVTNMRNFPLSRGTVAGLLKGYVGLSAAVYTEIFSMGLDNSAPKLLLSLTLGLPVIAFATMYIVRPCTPASEGDTSEHVHFVFTQISSISLSVYLLVTTILKDYISLSNAVCYTFLAIMVVLLLSPLAIPIKMTIFPAKKRVGSSGSLASGVEGYLDQSDPLLKGSSSAAQLGSYYDNEDSSDLETLLAEGEGAIRKKRRPRRGENFKFREALIKADFWLLWLANFVGVGTGVTVLNNLAQIGAALGVNDATILLAIFSFCNFLGRLGSGAISEYFVRTRTIPRTVWMACAQVIMIFTFLLYASALNSALYIATALLGICFGAQFSVMVPTASELFGLKNFGIIYNFMVLGNPIGAILFSALLASYVYDAEAAKQQSSTCLGPSCFRLTFLVLSGVCGLGTILSVILTVRLKGVYQMLYSGGSFRLPESSSQ